MSHKYIHHHKRLSGAKLILLLICIISVYSGILLAVRWIGNTLEGPEIPEATASLDDRFDTQKITLEYGDRTWYYRGRELTNLLLIGKDWDNSNSSHSGRYAGQADFLLLLTLDRKNRTISTLQIDRDTIADIRIYGPIGDYTGIRQTQLCLAYAYGSTPKRCCENVTWSVSRLLGGIPIDGYITLDISGIAVLNDALGGITVTLEEDFSAMDPQMTKGTTLTLHGKQAEYYVRGRMHVGDGTNASRMNRQRTFLLCAEELIVQGLQNDINYFSKMLDSLSDYMTMSMERRWLIDKAYDCRDYSRQDITALAGSHTTGTDGFVEFHPDSESLRKYLTTQFFM